MFTVQNIRYLINVTVIFYKELIVADYYQMKARNAQKYLYFTYIVIRFWLFSSINISVWLKKSCIGQLWFIRSVSTYALCSCVSFPRGNSDLNDTLFAVIFIRHDLKHKFTHRRCDCGVFDTLHSMKAVLFSLLFSHTLIWESWPDLSCIF